VLGGNAVYAAVGAAIWAESVGIVSRVGENYPSDWLIEIAAQGFETSWIKVLEGDHDTRTFYAYLSPEERVDTNPTAHFLRVGLPLPPALIEYRSSTEGQDGRQDFGPLAVRPADLEFESGRVEAAHLAPMDFLTHSIVPARLRELGVHTISVDPSVRYMEPGFRPEIPVLVNGLDAFLPSEAELLAYFQPRPPGLWEMAESFSDFGCPIVVIKRGAAGQYIWDRDRSCRWHIPAYPARVRDVTGAGDAYCGGFLAGLQETGDALEAGLRGSVSASMAVEGSGALYALDSAPGLAQARLKSIRPLARLL
jgi:sugar/nucleoside kinase (ribokinase family)